MPLLNPDIESACTALQNLSTLASSQNGALKVRTECLQTVIKNLLLAEFQLSGRIIACNVASAKAAAHERNAKQRLKPNAFGTIRKNAARELQNRASAFRNQADKLLAACRAELLAQLREADIVTDDFQKLREHRVARPSEEWLDPSPHGGFEEESSTPHFQTNHWWPFAIASLRKGDLK